MVKVTFAINL